MWVLEQQMREEEAAAPAVEEKMDQVVVEPFDVSNVVVNGIELTAESSLSSLRAACGFHRLSNFWVKAEVLSKVGHLHAESGA